MSASANKFYYEPPREADWYSPEKIERISCEKDRAVLECVLNGNSFPIEICFPIAGGVRISAAQKGFFEPAALKSISRESKEECEVIYTDEYIATVFEEENSFSILLHSADGKNEFRIDSKDILIGFCDGEWKKAKLTHGIDQNECIYGFGERFNAFNHRGTHFTLWNVDAWSIGTTAYKCMPIWHSTTGYMVFFNSTYSCEVDVGVQDADILSLEFEGGIWDMYVYLGTPTENIIEYTGLTGKPVLPPEWAFRYWAGGGFQVWEDRGKDKYLDVVRDCMEGYKKLGINDLAAVFGEGLPFHNLPAYEILNETDTRMIGWNHPSMWIADMQKILETDDLDQIPYFKDINSREKQAHREVIDFTHPNAIKVIEGVYKEYWEWGLKGCMVDYGEILPLESITHDGHTGDEMHNFVSYWYNKVYHDAWSKHYGKDYILFSRSGCAGCQKWVANFGGDQKSDFEGLKKALYAMLSLTSCGFSTWGTDIGGYGGPPTDELYIRWLQFGAFNPLMRAHGAGKDRNPWTYGDTAVKVFKRLYGLRENLLDHIYNCAVTANKSGVPMVQSMQTAFPGVKSLMFCDEQYMFCQNLLVCPVLKENTVKKTVYFPSGRWYDLFSGEKYKGVSRTSVEAPLDKIPVYIKAGSVMDLRLAKSGKMFDIADGEKLSGLLITPPEKEIEAVTAEGTYKCVPFENGFAINAEGNYKSEVLIIYGNELKRVTIDGVSVPENAIKREGAYTSVRLCAAGFKKLSVEYSEKEG